MDCTQACASRTRGAPPEYAGSKPKAVAQISACQSINASLPDAQSGVRHQSP
jgi:hypothetical protein